MKLNILKSLKWIWNAPWSDCQDEKLAFTCNNNFTFSIILSFFHTISIGLRRSLVLINLLGYGAQADSNKFSNLVWHTWTTLCPRFSHNLPQIRTSPASNYLSQAASWSYSKMKSMRKYYINRAIIWLSFDLASLDHFRGKLNSYWISGLRPYWSLDFDDKSCLVRVEFSWKNG